MNSKNSPAFIATPLITPERIRRDPAEAFAIVPPWASNWAWSCEDPESLRQEGHDVPLATVLGRKHKRAYGFSAPQFAFLLELTRLGHSVVTNTNGKGPNPAVYAKVSFRDAPHDNMPLSRIFIEAGPNEAVSTIDILSDLRPENLQKAGAGKPTKFAVSKVLFHCKRLAQEREAGGTLPEGFSVEAYVDNLRALLAAIYPEPQSPAHAA